MFLWTKEFSVGVKELDQQHQHLFDLLNSLVVAVEKGESLVELMLLLDGVSNYNLYHLSSEEEYMKRLDCESQDHLSAHAWYRKNAKQRINGVRENLRAGILKAPELHEVIMFVGSWHVEHIFKVDKTYTACFNDHGLV